MFSASGHTEQNISSWQNWLALSRRFGEVSFNPWGSMYGIFTCIWLIFMGNVGNYTIHGSSANYELHEPDLFPYQGRCWEEAAFPKLPSLLLFPRNHSVFHTTNFNSQSFDKKLSVKLPQRTRHQPRTAPVIQISTVESWVEFVIPFLPWWFIEIYFHNDLLP